MNNYLYSEGTMKTTINNQVIDDKSYKFEYDGDIGKGVVQNNKESYYVELDNDDFEKIFKENPNGNSTNIENKLKNLLNKSKNTKSTTRKSKSKSKSTRKSMKPSIKSTSFQERNNSKSTTQSPKKSTRKSTRKSKRSLKKTNKMPLETNFLKTLI